MTEWWNVMNPVERERLWMEAQRKQERSEMWHAIGGWVMGIGLLAMTLFACHDAYVDSQRHEGTKDGLKIIQLVHCEAFNPHSPLCQILARN